MINTLGTKWLTCDNEEESDEEKKGKEKKAGLGQVVPDKNAIELALIKEAGTEEDKGEDQNADKGVIGDGSMSG